MATIITRRCKSTGTAAARITPVWCSTNSSTKAPCNQAISTHSMRRLPNMPAKIRMAGKASVPSSYSPSPAAISPKMPAISVASIHCDARASSPRWFHR